MTQTHTDRPVRPRAMQIEASSACQLRCPACPTTSGAISPAVGTGLLKVADLVRLLEGAPELRQIELSNYGEIFLNPALIDILRVCHERRIAVTANNGVNLNTVRPEVLEAVVRYHVRVMTVSIDGATQESYEKYRVRGKLDTVLANVVRINAQKRLLQSEAPHLRWQFVVFGHNEHEIGTARAMAESLGMEFVPKLSWSGSFSPVRDEAAVRRAMPGGAANRAEYRERAGQDYGGAICNQLWDSPQVNWDGKMLGCCRNFWGDFGSNAFADGFHSAVNSERMVHARAMLKGQAPARADVPCTTCEIYEGMAASGRWMAREDRAAGQIVGVEEAVVVAAEWHAAGRTKEAKVVVQRVIAAAPGHVGALRLLMTMERK